ncbi:hypothetical protein HBA54_24610 [Pelagibius litoralis]|uniref:Invasion protein IalB, involved in pathogenesis n=1 Tax=Pelagibius litoralis TaxID=374515 RepID=A0A967F2E1_9PROT|nr:invasion associated locus B family protein [Pelagibius litoralis]NIA71782.1 hypothetical protein [Pelagibius litoralis]
MNRMFSRALCLPLKPLGLALGLAAGLTAGSSLTATSALGDVERWSVVCGQSACLADYQAPGLQILIAPERGSRRLRAILRVSHQVGANAPIALQLDSGWTTSLRTSACNDLFCQAAVSLEATDQVLARFRRDLQGVAAYRVAEKTVVARFSLKGFSNALNQIQ